MQAMAPIWKQQLLAVAAVAGLTMSPAAGKAGESGQQLVVDTAVILAVDVSDSVDDNRYSLQMEGMARALEDQGVIDALTSGPNGKVALQLIVWADNVETALPWQIISRAEDARATTAQIRQLKHKAGEYTCMARMMSIVDERLLDDLPFQTQRIVLDVSGDGIDNCADPASVDVARDRLIGRSVTINGLPILVKGENETVGSGAYRAPGFGLRPLSRGPDTETTTLDKWFRAHVIGGPASFIHAAQGYEDFERAFRQKFVSEISGRIPPAYAAQMAASAP